MYSDEPHHVYSFTNTVWVNENIEDEKFRVCIIHGRGYKCV